MGEPMKFPTPEGLAASFRELARKVAREEIGLAVEDGRLVPVPRPVADPKTAKQPSVYIAGPMRGYPENNFPAFYRAEAWFKQRGFTVFNPARMDDEGPKAHPGNTYPREYYVRRDLAAVIKADYIATLRGWRGSKGASAEVFVARWLDKQVFTEMQNAAVEAPAFRGPEEIFASVGF